MAQDFGKMVWRLGMEFYTEKEDCCGCGACAIGAYDQERMDELLGFAPGPSADQDYICTVYAAPVGKRCTEG